MRRQPWAATHNPAIAGSLTRVDGAPGSHPGAAGRSKVERAHGWLDNWSRLVVRHERRLNVYIASLTNACFMTARSMTLG